jgi:phosphoribosylamine--glycine ligase
VDPGYPQAVQGGGTLPGLDRLAEQHGLTVFHAGTRWENEEWIVRGGRAAYVVAAAASREAARDQVYAAIADIGGSGWRYRSDIAADGVSAGASRPGRSSGGG